MTEPLTRWKEKVRQCLSDWWTLGQWAASQPVYAVVSAAALWPVLDALKAGDPTRLFPALMQVVAGVGGNLLANQLQQWKDRPDLTPGEVAEWVRRESMARPEVREQIDAVNEELGAILEARRAAGEERWAKLAERLTAELAMLGSLPRFQVQISGPVTSVRAGDQGIAVGQAYGGIVAQHVTVIGDRWEGRPGANAEENLQIYLRVLASTLGRLPLRGLDVGAGEPSQEQPRLGLAQVYVNLATKTRVAREPREHLGLEEDRPFLALEAVAANQRLVVLGDPGSGKSTLLSHLGLCLAMGAIEPAGDWLRRLSGWPPALRPVPIVVVLRDFARAIRGSSGDVGPRHLWDFVRERLVGQNLAFSEQPLHQAMETGRAIVLLDGMDEVPPGIERERLRDAVGAFQTRYARSRHVVTCRTLSYQDREWKLDEWPSFELAPFDAESIDRFIAVWHDELVRLGVVRSADAGDLTGRLRLAVRRPDLWRLAPNPLLLTVMTLVHTNGGELPDARAELYERTVDMLLWRWDQLRARRDETPRIRELLDAAGRQPLDLRVRLSKLAFEAHATGSSGDAERVSDVTEGALLRELATLHPNESRDWVLKVVDAIKLRAGLLLERAPGVYAFPHRTFQEYLAGAHLSSLNEFVREASRRLDERAYWHNVVLLSVGQLVYVNRNTAVPLALVGELCPSEQKDDPLHWRKAWVAGEALVEMGASRAADSQLGRDLLARVRSRLWELVERGRLGPVERVAAGNALGRLGDPRFREDRWFLLDEGRFGFVAIPAGPFVMGRERDRQRLSSGDFDEHEVGLPRYYLARYPVTVAQFKAFVDDTRFAPENPDCLRGLPNHPVVWVSWHNTRAYCDWLTERLRACADTPRDLADALLGRVDGRKWRVTLPSEAEWEKAARGPAPSRRVYPWGDDPDPDAANYADTGIGATSPVGSFPRGKSEPYGVLDLSGNVWEWTRSLWGRDAVKPANTDRYVPGPKTEDLGAPDDVHRVLRGGAFDVTGGHVRCAVRGRNLPGVRGRRLGFRVAVSPFVSDP